MSNIEIRNRAWELLWRGKWFWRLLGAMILLQVVSQAAISLLNGILTRMGVFTPQSVLADMERGGTLPEFSSGVIFEFSLSVALYLFFTFLFSGISSYGNNRLLNSAADDNGEDWMKRAFGGFKIPLELGWLAFRMMLVFFFWSAIAAIPPASAFLLFGGYVSMPETVAAAALFSLVMAAAIVAYTAVMAVPFYRYRYLFRIKADNPEWSAFECMRHCRSLTAGEKWRIFKHDCSYWRVFLLPLAFMTLIGGMVCTVFGFAGEIRDSDATGVFAVFAALGIVFLYFAFIASAIICAFYNGVGQSVLYREISSEKKKGDANEMVP